MALTLWKRGNIWHLLCGKEEEALFELEVQTIQPKSLYEILVLNIFLRFAFGSERGTLKNSFWTAEILSSAIP